MSDTDSTDDARKPELYLNHDDSSTTLDELDECSVNSSSEPFDCHIHKLTIPDWSAIKDELLLTAWVLYLRRNSLCEEPLSFSCEVSTPKEGRTYLRSDLASLDILDDGSVADVRNQVHVLAREVRDHLSLAEEEAVTLQAFVPGNEVSEILFEVEVRGRDEDIEVRVKASPPEMTDTMIGLQIDAFMHILKSIAATPEQTVKQAIAMHNREVCKIWEWGGQLPQKIDRSIHEDFVANARKFPDKPAVVSRAGQLSYAQLDELSTKLALYLRSQGIEPGKNVPLCFEKSAWTVVGVLAVMKAGATFVLTDPSQPEGRLRTIAMEVRADFVLTSENNHDLGQRIAPAAKVIRIGPSFLHSLEHGSESQLEPVSGHIPMYVQFTSGSTGKPKGILCTHANYTSGAIPRAEAVGYCTSTRVLDFTSYAFDVWIDCLCCTLATGGCLCVPTDDQRINDLSGAIRQLEVNMVHTTPSVARVLDADIIPSLQVLGLGGEALSARDADKWNKQTRLINAYGPSECTVGCAINNDIAPNRSYVSLGRGVGCILWIVNPDNHDELAPVGAVGELVVEGPIVGLGYVNEPEKTKEVYIDAPAWLKRGCRQMTGRNGRLYKTGDLVKYDPDGSGCIVFVGRKDQQVKIRGQRVELGEVEHHLNDHLPSKTAAVAEVIKPGGTGEPTLVAFIADQHTKFIAENECVAFSAQLQATLSKITETLTVDTPSYMIPSAYVPLREIPLLVSGKTDRKQLRSIGANMSRQQLAQLRAASSRAKRGPTTEKQKCLASLWCRLLADVEAPGLDENFFALGGDSLKAMKLVAAARQQGLVLTVAQIFANPTLEAMALAANAPEPSETEPIPPFSLLRADWTVDRARNEAAKLCQLPEAEIEDVLPLTPLQEILMAYSAKVDNAYVAQRVLHLADQDTKQKFRKALTKTINHCPILRTRIVHVPELGLIQVVTREASVLDTSEELHAYINGDQENAMALGTPLARFCFVKDNGNPGIHFVFTIHHTLYDGWSMPLIVDRLNRAYNGLDTTRTATFAHYIRYLQETDADASRGFWREQLAAASQRQFPVRAKPGYQPRPDCLLEQRIELQRPHSASTATVATLVRAAWAIVSAEASGSEDVVFGETLTGRNAPIAGAEECEGPMITTVPTRIKVKQNQTIIELLQGVQSHTVKRIAHEHFGLQNIRAMSQDGRRVYDNLFSGIVLHPYDESESKQELSDRPADGLVPVSDADAAKEALKFNSYAIMLVCTFDSEGVLVMSSFDTGIVSSTEMGEMLKRLETVLQRLNDSINHQKAVGSILRQHAPANQNERTSPQTFTKQPPTHGAHTTDEEHGGSSKERQKVLLSSWSRLLSVPKDDLNAESKFFDLGGDSIAAMKLASELKQLGYMLTIAQMFSARTLANMASRMRKDLPKERSVEPKHAQGPSERHADIIDSAVKAQLADKTWEIEAVYPTRPLQGIAVNGTIDLRFSVRYELLKFEEQIDKCKLLEACQRLVDNIEILRTVFARRSQGFFGIVLKSLEVPVHEYEVDDNVYDFAHSVCDVDVQSTMRLGTSFVKFFFVEGSNGQSCLIFRISHAQYDEICLPIMLQQLSTLYEGRPPNQCNPYSSWVHHITSESIPSSKPYWQDLLNGSEMTKLVPDTRLVSKKPISLQATIGISHRSKEFTLATFPTAAWALCLARRLKRNDIVFGEVASGRNTGFEGGDRVLGPCWQYIPFRARFQPGWKAADLLKAVQEQHLMSSQHEGMGLTEIVEHCTDWPRSTDWFDSVVHQAVSHVDELRFSSVKCQTETVYPYLEPLREWKIQAFDHGDQMTLEIVTFESWKKDAEAVVEDLVKAFKELLGCSSAELSLSLSERESEMEEEEA